MSKSETMYEAMTGIRDDIIESAGEYRFEKRKRFAWIGYAAAACLVLGVSVFGISRLAKEPSHLHEAAVPTEQTAAAPTGDTRRIVTGTNDTFNEEIPTVGQRLLLHSLEEALVSPENEGCLFDVEVRIWYFAEAEAYIEEQWGKVSEKQNDPAILRYNEEYGYWLENVYQPTEADLKAKDDGKDPAPAYFAEYWAKNAPQPEKDAYAAAQEAAREARDEYNANTCVEAMTPMKDAAMAKLLSSLSEAGIKLEQGETENGVVYRASGLLTREQIENFPVNDCGAFILWNNYAGAADE